MIREVRVTPTGPLTGLLSWDDGDGHRSLACALGWGGVAVDKREGDGATPVGRFALRRVLYRPDRVAAPATALPVAPIDPADGWCDDPTDPAYNRPVQLPYPTSHERMWRKDGLYDVVVVLGHNDDPVVPGQGSAVFLHCLRPDGGPTAGCVAVGREALLSLLECCDSETVLVIDPA